jgi:hypothetical protein
MTRMIFAMGRGLRLIGRALGVAGRATVALVGVCGVVAALANYTMTQGSGTNFGSIVVSTVHYVQMLVCDPTTPANCGGVKAGNTAATTDVAQVVSDPNVVAAINASIPAGTARIGYVSDDPCNSKIKLNAPFSTTSGGPVSLIALSGSTVIYVCSISAITDTAIKLSFIDGTGGSCAAAQHAIWGSTTAASGMSLAANGGFTQGSGNGSVGVTTAASALCLLQSGTSLVAGNVTYVQQ